MSFPRGQAIDLPRALARLFALVALVAAGWALAPARPAEADRPGARDFEQALPAVERIAGNGRAAAAGGHGGEGPVTHRSGVIVAPARFDAAGLAGEMRSLELRGRESGGEWTKWIEIANGDPAWLGGADELQLRTRGWRPQGTLHYVDVPTVAARAAAGDAGKPDVVSRRAWGADLSDGGCEPRRKASYGQVRSTVVHHTVGSNKYTRAEAPSVVLAICRYHRNALGWDDIGYNALVDRFGTIYAGRDGGLGRPVIGAHAQGVNAQTSGVAVMGTHTKKDIGKPAMRGLTRWLAWKLVTHGRTTEGMARMVSSGGATSRYEKGDRFQMQRIVGHRRTNLTECPGDALNGQLYRLRQRVQGRIDRNGGIDPGDGGIGRTG